MILNCYTKFHYSLYALNINIYMEVDVIHLKNFDVSNGECPFRI